MKNEDKAIEKAVEILKDGGIVIYPTDTAFGIGVRIDRPDSVDRLFRIRKRPRTQATPVLVSSPSMALAYLDSPSKIVRRLMDEHWPGALTIIARCHKDRIYSPIRGGGETIGVRQPDHEMALALIDGVGVPILGPSANFHGKQTPFYEADLDPKLMKLVDFVLSGACKKHQASTVVDTTVRPAAILRQGACILKAEELLMKQKPVVLEIDTSVMKEVSVGLVIDGKTHKKRLVSDTSRAQALLPLIKKMLKETNLTLADIREISVVQGPGSFTGLRVGISVANMLSVLLGIPINGKKTLATPTYS